MNKDVLIKVSEDTRRQIKIQASTMNMSIKDYVQYLADLAIKK